MGLLGGLSGGLQRINSNRLVESRQRETSRSNRAREAISNRRVDIDKFRADTERSRQRTASEKDQRNAVIAKTQRDVDFYQNVNNPVALRKVKLSEVLATQNFIISPDQISDEMLNGPVLQSMKEFNGLLLDAKKKGDSSKETGLILDAKADEVAGFLGETNPETQALRKRALGFRKEQNDKDIETLADIITKGGSATPEEIAESRRIIAKGGEGVIEGAKDIMELRQKGGENSTGAQAPSFQDVLNNEGAKLQKLHDQGGLDDATKEQKIIALMQLGGYSEEKYDEVESMLDDAMSAAAGLSPEDITKRKELVSKRDKQQANIDNPLTIDPIENNIQIAKDWLDLLGNSIELK